MDREALRLWLEEGLSLEAIGHRVGRHPSTVAYWVEKHGLEPANRARHSARGGIPRETLEQLIARPLTIREIAAEIDRSTATVRYWLRRYGLQTRGRRNTVTPTADGRGRGTCRRHGEVEFVRRPDGAWRCVECRVESVADRRRRVKQTLVAEAGGSCVLCGYRRSLAALQFHHREPAEKAFAVAGRGVARSLDAARAEAAKCVLLCANCHAEVEAGDASLPANIRAGVADHPR